MKKLELAKEYPPDGEDEAIEEINQRIEAFLRKEYEAANLKPARRSVHAKSPGCLKGEFIVNEDIPEKAKAGMFVQPGSYECWVRFSNASQFVKSDKKTDTRGLAIKVMGVQGEKILEEKKDALTQDFLFLNSKNFPIASAKDFARFTKWFLTKNFIYGYILSPIIRRWFQMLSLIKNVSQKVLNPLAISWYSTTPYKWGDHAVKYCLKPKKDIGTDGIDTSDPDFLQKVISDTLDKGSISFDFMLQFQIDPYKMPIENSKKVWSEKLSPFITVGSVKISKQDFTSSKHQEYCENLSFSTWHSLLDHWPLGGSNRTHRTSYLLGSRLRHEFNGAVDIEPTGFSDYDLFMKGDKLGDWRPSATSFQYPFQWAQNLCSVQSPDFITGTGTGRAGA